MYLDVKTELITLMMNMSDLCVNLHLEGSHLPSTTLILPELDKFF